VVAELGDLGDAVEADAVLVAALDPAFVPVADAAALFALASEPDSGVLVEAVSLAAGFAALVGAAARSALWDLSVGDADAAFFVADEVSLDALPV